MDTKTTPAVPVNVCLHSTLFAESKSRRCEGAQAVSTGNCGDAQIVAVLGCKVQAQRAEARGLEAALCSCTPPAPLSKGDHPAERVGKATPSFFSGTGQPKSGLGLTVAAQT